MSPKETFGVLRNSLNAFQPPYRRFRYSPLVIPGVRVCRCKSFPWNVFSGLVNGFPIAPQPGQGQRVLTDGVRTDET